MSGKALHPDSDYLQVSVNLAAFMVWQQILSLHNTELLLMYHIAAFMKESSFQFIFFLSQEMQQIDFLQACDFMLYISCTFHYMSFKIQIRLMHTVIKDIIIAPEYKESHFMFHDLFHSPHIENAQC